MRPSVVVTAPPPPPIDAQREALSRTAHREAYQRLICAPNTPLESFLRMFVLDDDLAIRLELRRDGVVTRVELLMMLDDKIMISFS
jgi:hypothetical protein